MTDTRGPHSPDDPARLNGWKDISAFLGKGVRTAQRWERTLKMPVHRIGHKGGEIVFAYRRELEEWLATAPFEAEPADEGAPGNGVNGAPTAHPDGAPDGVNGGALTAASAPPRRRWLAVSMLGLLGVIVAVAAAIGTGGLSGGSSSVERLATRQPASWKVTGNHLQTFDATGTPVWDHEFEFVLTDYSQHDHLGIYASKVEIRDLDGDGASETLFSAVAEVGRRRDLYAFNSDGTLRFIDRPNGSVTFGDTMYEPPWLSQKVFVGTEVDGPPAIWSVAIHGLWFPTRLRRLDASGRLLSEYWSNGYIETVREATWRGRPVLLVGATSNETGGTSLAVFDRDNVTGSAPADNPRYQCRTCPPGWPAAFIAFSRTCLDRTGGDQAIVADMWPEGENRLKVLVRHVAWPRPGLRPLNIADLVYTLDTQFRLVSIDATKEYVALHARLEAEGFLDHPFGPDDEREIGMAKRWNGTAFETIGPVAVSR